MEVANVLVNLGDVHSELGDAPLARERFTNQSEAEGSCHGVYLDRQSLPGIVSGGEALSWARGSILANPVLCPVSDHL